MWRKIEKLQDWKENSSNSLYTIAKFNKKKSAMIKYNHTILHQRSLFMRTKTKETTLIHRRISILAMISAICIVTRLYFTWIPNVQPVTTIILFVSLYFSVFASLAVAFVTVLVTAFMLGMGYWVIGQILAFFVVVVLFHCVCKLPFTRKLLVQAVLMFLSGIIYGAVVSAFDVFIFQIDSFFAYYLAGVSFDIMHGLGNVVFYLLLKKPFELFNERYFKRINIQEEVK